MHIHLNSCSLCRDPTPPTGIEQQPQKMNIAEVHTKGGGEKGPQDIDAPQDTIPAPVDLHPPHSASCITRT